MTKTVKKIAIMTSGGDGSYAGLKEFANKETGDRLRHRSKHCCRSHR